MRISSLSSTYGHENPVPDLALQMHTDPRRSKTGSRSGVKEARVLRLNVKILTSKFNIGPVS
jgi:hypothetical protein